eukprot:3971574-Alexandrium_andersonii.AAC.1
MPCVSPSREGRLLHHGSARGLGGACGAARPPACPSVPTAWRSCVRWRLPPPCCAYASASAARASWPS